MFLYAIDRQGTLSNARRTATGGYVVDARLARTGVLQYPERGEGQRRHLNTAEVLKESLDLLASVPVTNRHPAKFVTPETYRDHAAGHVMGTPTFDGKYLHATLAIQDAGLIRDIEDGVSREVSMGYTFLAETRDGVTEDGEAFDQVRTQIVWNHCAILPAGRAGAEVGLVLDSNEIPNQEVFVKLKIQGTEVLPDAAQAAIDGIEGQLAALRSELDVVREALAVATSQEAVDGAVAEKLAKDAAAVAEAARLERLKVGFPGVSFDGRSGEYLQAYDEILTERARLDPEGLGLIKGQAPKAVIETAVPSAREAMLQTMRQRHRS